MESQYENAEGRGNPRNGFYSLTHAARIWEMAANLEGGVEYSERYGGLETLRSLDDSLTYTDIVEAGTEAGIDSRCIEIADHLFSKGYGSQEVVVGNGKVELSEEEEKRINSRAIRISSTLALAQGLGTIIGVEAEYIPMIPGLIGVLTAIPITQMRGYSLIKRYLTRRALNKKRFAERQELERKLVGEKE